MEKLFKSIPDILFIEANRHSAPALYKMISEIQPICLALYQMFEHSSMGIYLTDGDGIMRYFNKAYENLTGYKREDIIGRHVQYLVDQGTIPYSVAAETLKRKAPVSIDLFFELSGRLVTVCTTPLFDKKNNISVIIGNLTDITSLIHSKEPSISPCLETNSRREECIEALKNRTSISANNEKMKWLYYYAHKASKSKAPILISGETGVGKDEMAKFIYENSPRNTGPFVQVNCGAIPDNLIESELFGYVGGAFTGASPQGKMGLFEAANGGTIFLDEIGELPYHVQAKLLNVLQSQKLTRIGSTKPISLDIRIISATNRDLLQMVKDKTFREDLFYRLNVVPLEIPPLRERKDDILPLSMKFLSDINQQSVKQFTFSPSAITAMESYNWPGNIRELKNLIERSTIFCEGYVITEDILFNNSPATASAADWEMNLQKTLAQIEFNYMEQYYNHYGNIRDAASALGMDKSTFSRKFNSYLKSFS